MASSRTRAVVLAVVATLAAFLVQPVPAHAQAAPPAPPAPQATAPDVALVARTNDKSVEETRRILADPTARLDATQRIYYVEPAPDRAPVAVEAAPAAAGAFPYADTFRLHSRPGSVRTIYLDFDGETIAGTAWNGSFGAPVEPFFAEPFSTDGSPAFSAAEQDAVQSVWQRVAEDYAPFDIDVTTQDPGPAAITRSGPSDLVYGTRALITDAPEVGSDCGCGGVAYVGVFDDASTHAYYQPAWIAAQNLGHNTKYIAEAASHEVGHNLGLSHDGTSTLGYYAGAGAWAPIMGVAYYKPLSQFSKGDYPDANNREPDLDVIAANGGTPIADDYGDTPGASMGLGSGPAVAAGGLISTDADVDVFRVEAAAGAATFQVAPAAVSPNLDLLLEVRDGAGNLLASDDAPSALVNYDSASGLSASVSTTLPAAGVYFVAVSGVGAGSLATGYNGYASLGAYRLTGTVATGARTVSVADAPTVLEGSAGHTTTADFAVTLSTAAPDPVTVVASTVGGTATAGSDYVAASSTVTFAAGVTSMPFPVTVIGDDAVELGETVLVGLAGPSGVLLGDTLATGFITDDDYAAWISDAPAVIEGPAGVEATAVFTISLSSAVPSTVSVVASTADGTATAGSDYSATSSTVTFPSGVTSMAFPVTIFGDGTAENTETFFVNLTSPVGLALGDPQGLGTITKDDFALSVSDAAAVREGDVGVNTMALFNVSLFPTAPKQVTVVASTADGTATGGTDYAAFSSTITFPAGAAVVPLPVTILGDRPIEADETYFVNLSGPTGGAFIVDAQGAGSIINDDLVVSRSWGYNGYAQVGDNTLTSRSRPTVVNLGQVDAVAAGGFHSLALQGGTVYSWGLGHVGQLGRSPTQPRVPLPVGGLSGVTAISAGVFHSLALKSDGTVWAWGYNAYGQVGDGTTVDRPAPVQVVGLSGVVAVAAGGLHNLALKSDGTVWAWGYNGVGQLGTAGPTQSTTAHAVPGLTGVTAIGAGAYHSLAVRAGGSVAAWGWNPWGQLGDGTTTNRSAPVTVAGLTGIVAVAGGTGHSLALGADGLVRSWGLGASGQLGRPVGGAFSATPAVVPGITDVTKVAAGGYHSVVLRPEGIVWAWGWNAFGQLGDGSTVDQAAPIPIMYAAVFSISAGVGHGV
ncbi:MAG: hypothetical protein QOG43_2750, partial [Actinomycetota bacterium]|nr:hypothetical protein [Actinomycetota bacterium]